MKLDEIILVLKSSIGSMKSDISSTVNELKKLTNTTSTVTNTMNKVSKTIEPVSNNLNKATNSANTFNKAINSAPQQSYIQLEGELKRVKKQYNDLNDILKTYESSLTGQTPERMKKTKESPLITTSGWETKKTTVWADSFADAEQKLESLSQRMSEIRRKIAALQNSGGNSLNPLKQSADQASQSMKNANANTTNFSKGMKKLNGSLSKIATIGSTVKGAIDGLSKKFSSFNKSASKGFDSLYFKMKKFGLGLLGIRTAMAFLTKSTQAYISFDSELQQSIQNSYQMLGALLAPAIIYVAQAFATAVNYIYQFVTALTGIDLVARANAKALQTQAKAAKGAAAAQRGLLAMDEITNLPTEPSGGGGAAPQIDIGEIKPNELINDIVDALKNGEWHRAGEIIAESIDKALGSIDWNKIHSGAEYIGTGLALFLNGVFELDWKLLGTTLGNGIQTAIVFAFGFVENFEFARLGNGLGRALNGVFESINWAMLGQTVSDAIIGILNMITTFFVAADWEQIGEDIKTFLVNIDWAGIASAVFEAIKAAFTGADQLLSAIFGSAGATIIEVLIGSILVLQGVMTAFNIVLGITALAEAGVLWPIIAIIAAVVAVVAVIVLLIKHFDEIKEVAIGVFNMIWETIKTVFQAMMDHLQGFIDGVKDVFKSAVSIITGPFKDTVRVIKLLLQGDLLGAIKAVGKGIANAFIRPLNVAIAGINLVLAPVRALIVALGKVTGKNWTMQNIKIPKIPTLEVGTNEIKAEGLYHLHEGEAVVPKKYNPATDGYNDGADNRQIIDLLIDLNSSMIQYAERPININMDSKKVAEATYDNIQMIHNNKNVSGVMTRS